MQQITDEQFIAAMDQAVKDKGDWNQAPGSYRSFSGATPYCIVGYALALISEDLCPRDNKHNADKVLANLGCSERVATAAFAAQYSNDRGNHWGQVLATFHAALRMWQPGVDTLFLIRRADAEGARRSMYHSPIRSFEQAQAQMQSLSEALGKAKIMLGTVSYEWENGISPETFGIITGQPVLVKKDHALTA